jgi:hypothetical protein
MFNFKENTAEQDFVNKFQNMAEMLAEDNYQKMKGLNNNNHNLN